MSLDSNTDRPVRIVWNVTVNRALAERVTRLLPKDDFDISPKKGSRSSLIEGLLQNWAESMEKLKEKGLETNAQT